MFEEYEVDYASRLCARCGCGLELILKDISTVRYKPQRLW